MAEQHRVGDHAEERRADHEPGRREPGRAAGERGRGEQPDDAERRRDEIEGGRELAVRSAVGASRTSASAGVRRRRRARSSPPPVRAAASARARAAPTPAPRRTTLTTQRHERGQDHARGRGEEHRVAGPGVPRAQLGAERAEREHAVHAAQQPAVAEAHEPAARRDPEEREPARGPLQQDRRRVEVHVRRLPRPASGDHGEVPRGAR